MPRKDPRHPGPAAPQALPLLLALAGAGVVMSQQRFALPLSIDNIAATGDSLLLAAGNCLYKLSPSLQKELGLQLLEGAQNCTHPAGTRNKLLLPDLQGGLLLTGWTLHKGSCQVRWLSDLQLVSNQTEVVSCLPQGSTTGLLFKPPEDPERYLALAATYQVPGVTCVSSASDANTALTMRQLPDLSLASGDSATVKRKKEQPLHFVDAFLWDKHLFFPYYPFGEAPAEAQPSVALLQIPKKKSDLFFVFGEVRLDCGGRGILLSSSLMGAEGWWAGVFSTNQSGRSWNSTALCIFSTQEMVNRTTDSKCSSTTVINEPSDCIFLHAFFCPCHSSAKWLTSIK